MNATGDKKVQVVKCMNLPVDGKWNGTIFVKNDCEITTGDNILLKYPLALD